MRIWNGVLPLLLAAQQGPAAVAFVPSSHRTLYPQSLLAAVSSPSVTQPDELVDLGTLIEAHISDNDVELAEAELRSALKKGTSRPPPEAFESIILAWLSDADAGATDITAAAGRAEQLLDEMELVHQPNGVIYRKLIDAWCSAAMREELGSENASTNGELSGEAVVADNSLLDQVDRDIGERQRKKEMEDTYNRAKSAAQHAGKILDRMENLYLETRIDDLLPGVSQYKGVINAWKVLGSSKEVEDAIRQINARRDALFAAAEIDAGLSGSKKAIASHKDILKIVMRLDDETLSKRLVYRRFGRKVEVDDNGTKITDAGYLGIVTSTHNYNLIIDALAKSGRPWAGDQAEAILEYMVDRYSSGENMYIRPNQISLNLCINAYAMSPKADSAKRAEALLGKLAKWRREYKLGLHPDCTTYNSIIKAWGLSRSVDAVQNAERVFADLEKDGRVSPDEISYSSLLNVYAKNSWRDSSAANKAENLLLKMYQEHQQSDGNIAPSVRCFNAALDAHARSRDKSAGRRALKLLSLMEDMKHASGNSEFFPDVWSYNLVIKALSKGGDRTAEKQALELLDRMEKWSKEGNERVSPDLITYNTVIDAFAKSRNKGSAEAAEGLYYRMKEGAVHPDAFTVASVIQSWALSGFDKSSARRAIEVFEDARQDPRIELDTASYNAMLNCLSKSGSRNSLARALFRNAPDRAEALLGEMEAESAKGNKRIRPDVISYTSTISALARSKDRTAPYRAMKILARMEAKAASGDQSVRPNSITYTAAIKCWARSRDKVKAIQAKSLLDWCEEQYRRGNPDARPTVVIYNQVLNACAYTAGSGDDKIMEEAFKIGCFAFEELRRSTYIRPNHISFANFLDVVSKLMPEGDLHDELIGNILKGCIREGVVSNLVIRRLRGATSADLFKSLLGDANARSLPQHWTRNL